jgi:myo-inositol 2-dehydrogenase / D-chiro-inositol 1-dehydrogenase
MRTRILSLVGLVSFTPHWLHDVYTCALVGRILQAAAKQYNIPRFTNDAMEVITDPEVEAVWICSPSSYHAEQIKACAANKKHVFCEKPIATELTETVEAINACNAAGVKLMIGLQRRFDQNFKRVQVAVQRKEVGTPIMIKLCSRDPSPPPYSYVKVHRAATLLCV